VHYNHTKKEREVGVWNIDLQRRSSATAKIVRDMDVGAHSLSLSTCKCSVQPTSIKFTDALLTTYVSLLAFNSTPNLHSSIPPPRFQVEIEKRRLGVDGQSGQNIGYRQP